MSATQQIETSNRYARCINASKRIRWEIDADVIRGRALDVSQKFLPDGLSLVNELPFLTTAEQRFLSQVQGRTYANIFGLVERFINAKVLELSRDHWFGDQVALEALVRFSEEELKHQELFRRVEALAADGMPHGYKVVPDPDDVAKIVLGRSTWSVLALTCHIEIFTQVHYKKSIAPDDDLSALWKDVFLYHWKEESQHAILDELEWRREDGRLNAGERDAVRIWITSVVRSQEVAVLVGKRTSQPSLERLYLLLGRSLSALGTDNLQSRRIDLDVTAALLGGDQLLCVFSFVACGISRFLEEVS